MGPEAPKLIVSHYYLTSLLLSDFTEILKYTAKDSCVSNIIYSLRILFLKPYIYYVCAYVKQYNVTIKQKELYLH